MSQNYRDELVQVAAVAIAAIQDYDSGDTSVHGFPEVVKDVLNERHRQVAKWGVNHRHPFLWMTILGEEFGEVCQAALKMEFGDDEQGDSRFSIRAAQGIGK